MADEATKADKPELRIGSYRLIQQLGSGGMSSVFRAVHDETGHEVAVKVLPRTLAKNPTLLQRFLREAKSAEALEHPNIVSIYDRGVDQGRHYLVLEFVPGGDLHDRVRSQGALPIAEAIRVIKEVAAGLSYAASLGLIHRDIKPANILVAPSGRVKIIDLGLALQAENEDERVTRDGTTVGTVDYMSPEQARDSRATSEKSDIYSLGCTLYYLLTGSAPFAGGDLADKLARHCTQPAPDPRKLRPDVPESLAAITRRMMAKRPENRFETYDRLIAALDAVSLDGSSPAPVLDALIDDDDDLLAGPAAPAMDALIVDDSQPELPVAKPSGPPKRREPAMDALIVDDSEPELPVTKPGRPARAREKEAPPVDMLSMSELAALDEDTPAVKPRKPPRPAAPRPTEPEPALSALLDEGDGGDEHVAALPGSKGRSSFQFGDTSTSTLIKRSIAIGVAVILLVIGAHQLYEASRDNPSGGTAVENERPSEPSTAVVGTGPSHSGPTRPGASGPSAPNVTVIRKPETPKESEAPKPPPPWAEPTDPTPAAVADTDFGQGVESRFVPEWAAQPIPDRLGALVPLRRLVAPNATNEKSNLRQGLEVIGTTATLELADNGPFWEDDLRVPGEARLVRARPGFRPIIAVEAPKLPVVREQPAVIVLEGKQLILDGLDLIVDVDELPRNQTALFECAGASLTLRDCTVTVLNPKGAPFSVVRTVPSARPSRVRLERSYVRGPRLTALELAGGTADAVVSRSVLLTGGVPLITIPGKDAGAERKVHVVRSVVACKAPVFELNAPPSGQRPKALTVRAFGSTFASVAGASPPSLIVSRGGGGAPAERVQWLGDFNEFAGWSTLYSESGTKVADLAAARNVWAGTDPASRVQPNAWPEAPHFDRIAPDQLQVLAQDRLATLQRVAVPSGFLHEKTYFVFERPAVPSPSPEVLNPKPMPVMLTSPPPQPPPPRPAPASAVTKSGAMPTGPSRPVPKAAPNAPAATVAQPLVFDPKAAPWNGDLGLYIREQLATADTKLRVYVKGQGEYPFTPVQVPAGISLEILGEPDRAPGDVPTWFPATAASAGVDALIEVRDANLVLSGVNFSREPSSQPKVLFKVDRGHLVVYRCRLLSPGFADAGGGGLIAFRAVSTQPSTPAAGPFSAPVDRPICRLVDCTLITGGDAIAAEVGRGRVALTNCALAAGGSAFVLSPAKVARARLEADLALDHCTVTAERNFALLEPWPGSEPGPDRPWLVSSQSCAFVASYAAGPREHVLLRSRGESVAHGALFWQGNTDAFEVPYFTAVDDRSPAPNLRPDLRRQWIELWGQNHFRSVVGPGTGKVGAPPSVRFADKLKPGEVTPRDLVLESRDRRSPEHGADANVLKLTVPTPRGGRKN